MFFYYYFLFLNFTLFYFTILYWFCHTLTWISHGCTWVPNPEPSSHLPPHIISLDRPSAPDPSILYPVSNLDWWFISYMILYMFQCHSPKSSHLLPLPQSPKKCSIHLCLFCCLAYRISLSTLFICSCKFFFFYLRALSILIMPFKFSIIIPTSFSYMNLILMVTLLLQSTFFFFSRERINCLIKEAYN